MAAADLLPYLFTEQISGENVEKRSVACPAALARHTETVTVEMPGSSWP